MVGWISKPQNPNCTLLHSMSKDEPARWWVLRACKCNRVAHERFPDICDVICPETTFDPDCSCKNPMNAGTLCDEPMCKLGDEIYCFNQIIYQNQVCKANVDRGRVNEIPWCGCGSNGRIMNGRCACNENYMGDFCEEYVPPKYTSTPSTYQGLSSKGRTSAIVVPTTIGAIVLLACICACICRKRRSYASGFQVQTPIPGSTIPGATAPMMGPPPPIAGGPIDPPYAPPMEMNGQPPPGYPSAPPAYPSAPTPAGAFSITTTYTFTPPTPGAVPDPDQRTSTFDDD